MVLRSRQVLGITLLSLGVVVGCQESESGGSALSGDGTVVLPGCEVLTYQMQMLEEVNAARVESRTCGEDFYTATHLLTYSCQLYEAADRHSQDMADNNFFSHTGSDGLSVSHRVTATGYNWTAVGENIAAGYPSVEAVMQGWLDSPGHCANIMSDQFQDFAISRVDTDTADFNKYWTQVFASP